MIVPCVVHYDYLSCPRAAADDQRFVGPLVLVMIEEREVFLRVDVNVVGLL